MIIAVKRTRFRSSGTRQAFVSQESTGPLLLLGLGLGLGLGCSLVRVLCRRFDLWPCRHRPCRLLPALALLELRLTEEDGRASGRFDLLPRRLREAVCGD